MKKKWIFLVYLVVLVIAVAIIVPYSKLQTANKAFDEGAYEQACEQFEALTSNIFFFKQAKEKQRECLYKMADEALSNKAYDEALKYYIQLGDIERAKETRLTAADEHVQKGEYKAAAELYEVLKETQKSKDAWASYAEQCISEKNYKEAVDTYIKLENDEKLQSARAEWAAYLMEQHSYLQAAEQYRLCNMEAEAQDATYQHAGYLIENGRAAEVPELLKGMTGDRTARTMLDAAKAAASQGSEKSLAEIAGAYGSYITDVNTQLAYCNLLRYDEIDLNLVYPDGVEVEMDLAKYQVYEYLLSDLPEEEITVDYSKLLIFSREEEKPILKAVTSFTEADSAAVSEKEAQRRMTSEYSYIVKLQPALMDSLFLSTVANTIEECTGILLLETGYYPAGSLRIKTTNVSSGRYAPVTMGVIYNTYVYYDAYEGITVYDVNDPLHAECYYFYNTDPMISHCTIGNAYNEKDMDLSSEEIEAILEALEDKESEASAEILAKYSQETIDFVAYNGWGDYLYIPEEDEQGNQIGKTYSMDDKTEWNVDKYMIGKYEESWMEDQVANGVVDEIAFYGFLMQLE